MAAVAPAATGSAKSADAVTAVWDPRRVTALMARMQAPGTPVAGGHHPVPSATTVASPAIGPRIAAGRERVRHMSRRLRRMSTR